MNAAKEIAALNAARGRSANGATPSQPGATPRERYPIIGRGTRLYDGKDYFMIYDFVGAHMHFSDPEWDGDPTEPVIPNSSDPSP